jgi:hypothetical protein
MRPATLECSRRCSRLLHVNLGASKPRNSSSVTNMGTFSLWRSPFHRSMQPWVVTMGPTLGRFVISCFVNLHHAPFENSQVMKSQLLGSSATHPFESDGLDKYRHYSISEFWDSGTLRLPHLILPEMNFSAVRIRCHASYWIERLLLILGFGSLDL